MKKENGILGKLFGVKNGPAETDKPVPVTVTAYSQPHVLQQRMREEKMTHGQTVMANLSPVRLENAFGKMILYFCPMKNIEVLQTLSDGDGGSLPAEVKVEGLTVPDDCKPGYYALKNVTITSNGTMQVRATEETVWEQVKYERSW